MTDELLHALVEALQAKPGSTARELAMRLRDHGFSVHKSDLNSIFYSAPQFFWHQSSGSAAPTWYLLRPSVSAPSPDTQPAYDGALPFPLYPWQDDALRAWRAQKRRAVVEAVTGSGKTLVGLAAAFDKLQRGGKVQILVPSIALLAQWATLMHDTFPDYRTGLLGGGHAADLRDVDLVVAVVNSARDRAPAGVNDALLVADEVHRYGTPRNVGALVPGVFSERLGLSATYARTDDGIDEYLGPFFGKTCFALDYRRAIDDGVVAHFKVALVGVRFDRQEKSKYLELDELAKKLRAKLIHKADVTPEPFGTFMAEVNRLRKDGCRELKILAGRYLDAFSKRRQLLANAATKLELLESLSPAICDADGTLVFAEQKNAAKEAAEVLQNCDVLAAAMHSGIHHDEREEILAQFAQGSLEALCAPRVLDEGVDVPAADLGVVLAASRTPRQMIQRMGRVLRRKTDGRLARFVVIYVQGTYEDPSEGAHETFLEEITDVADDVMDFGVDYDWQELTEYLRDW